MITRIVLLKLAEEYACADTRREVATYSREVLAGIPGVIGVETGTAADAATGNDWDVALVVHFARLADMEPYRVHPDHRAYVDDYLSPKLQAIKSWSFEVGE